LLIAKSTLFFKVYSMRHLSFAFLLSYFAIAGCNAQIDAKVTPTQAAITPNVQIHAQAQASPKPEANQIEEGRYWLGGTDQALEVQGDSFRYETEGGAQEWRSLSSLQAIKTGVIYDGKDYWCLSTMQPKTGGASCSKEGWVTQQVPASTQAEPSSPDRN
jgi:hypothetical protein